jgi:hypothetical protein
MKKSDFKPGFEAIVKPAFGKDPEKTFAQKEYRVILENLDPHSNSYAFVSRKGFRQKITLSRLQYPRETKMIESNEISVERLKECPAMVATMMKVFVSGLPEQVTSSEISENESSLLLSYTLVWVALNLLMSQEELIKINTLSNQIGDHLWKIIESGKPCQ